MAGRGIILLISLFFLRIPVLSAVTSYNNAAREIMDDIQASMNRFSKYLSASCNVRRGHAVQNYAEKNIDEYTKSLRIRAGAGTNYECIGSYVSGDQVVITDQTTVKGRVWGRTDKGWICMEYVI